MKTIEVGTLVRSVDDGVIGLVTKVLMCDYDGQYYRVKWFDGATGDHTRIALEVLNEKH